MVEVGSEHRGEHHRDRRLDVRPEDGAEPPASTADRLHEVVTRLFGQPVPLRLRAWDGSESGPPDAQLITVRSRRALRRLLWRPDELGLARAYIAGELAIEGSLVGLLEQLAGFGRSEAVRPEAADRRELLRTAVLLGAVGPQPKRPDEESGGPLPALAPDVAAAMFGERRAAGPGVWSAGSDLPAAEEAGLATLADRLGLQPGMRVLDIGAGWGAFPAYAAGRYGIQGRGVTTTDAQAATANQRLAELGLADAVEILAGDWRGLDDGAYDAIVDSTVLGDHGAVAASTRSDDAEALHRLLRPGGRVVLHVVGRRRPPSDRGFRAAYLGTGGRLPRLGQVVTALETADLEVVRIESIRADLAGTVRAWTTNVEHGFEQGAIPPTGAMRLWHLVLAGLVTALEARLLSGYRVVAVRPA